VVGEVMVMVVGVEKAKVGTEEREGADEGA
jgi:hypothetical protein